MNRPRIFYGYWILVAAFFISLVYSGSVVYVFGFFVKPLQLEMGWGRGEIMLGFTLFALTGGFASPPAGWLVDRFGGRKVVLVCALASGALFCLLALVSLPAVLSGFHAFHDVFPNWLISISVISLVAWIAQRLT